ncbi:MAG: Fic family protein [Stagnimonas sp.]|nr:Fic family protein [Stagnimonas sp.]
MNGGEYSFVWQRPDWPNWQFDLTRVAVPLAAVSRAQGELFGRLADVGLALRDQAALSALTEDVVQTSAIEGESLNAQSVRSSVARRLGVDIGALAPADRQVDGLVDMVLDATGASQAPLTAERLRGWHAALFPTGFSGLHQIEVGCWRSDAEGPMQVVSGPHQRQRVHFEAPPAARLDAEMQRFLAWANADTGEPLLLKSGLAHLWFVTIHPFDDGNGRIARALGDLFLTRADGHAPRFYSLSAEIQRQRAAYYAVLERTQRGGLEVTEWLLWFLDTLGSAVLAAQQGLDAVLHKARFWRHWSGTPMNARQIKLLNRLLDGYEGKLTSGRWARMADCSSDTALRDISELMRMGVLQPMPGGGRSAGYELAPV